MLFIMAFGTTFYMIMENVSIQDIFLSILACALQIFYRVEDLRGEGGGMHSPENFWEVKGLLSKILSPFQTLA